MQKSTLPSPTSSDGRYSVPEIENILGFKLPLPGPSTPFVRHIGVGSDFVDKFLACHAHTIRPKTPLTTPTSSTNTATTTSLTGTPPTPASQATPKTIATPSSHPSVSSSNSSVSVIPVLNEDSPNLFSQQSCQHFLRFESEHEWNASIAAEHADFQRWKSLQYGVPTIKLSDIIQWRLMNWCLSNIRAQNKTRDLMLNSPPATLNPLTSPFSPMLDTADTFAASALGSGAGRHGTFSPHGSHAASVLANMDQPTLSGKKSGTPPTSGALSKSHLSPMSQLTNIANQHQSTKKSPTTSANSATASSADTKPNSKRTSSSIGLADSENKKSKQSAAPASPPAARRKTTPTAKKAAQNAASRH